MRQKEWITKGVGRNFITIDVTDHLVCINVYNMKYVLEDYSFESLTKKEKTNNFLSQYAGDTLRYKIIKWIYNEEK